MRVMDSGANKLNYNLYINAGRSLVWGDHSGSSQMMSAAGNRDTRLDIFGQIPALQDVAIGPYTDSIIATVNF
jgi:spore coat protein U-like protein